jgi:exodeoxyribonuclease-5
MLLSTDQKNAQKSLMDWYKSTNRPQFITLGGYAGTGKTTLISIFRNKLAKENPKLRVAFCSFTGKAARVLKNNLQLNKSVYPQDSVSTIHGLLYTPIMNDSFQIVGWKKKEHENLEADLIIVDEASMVDELIWYDILSLGLPIVAVGGHGQLPPINGDFSLMKAPQLRLEEIHRQARDNPIIKLSVMAREDGMLPYGQFDCNVKKIRRGDDGSEQDIADLLSGYTYDTLILCGYNKTRININAFVRTSRGGDSIEPTSKDRVICLRNNRASQIFNGMLGWIKSIYVEDDKKYMAEIEMDGEDIRFTGSIARKQFNDPDVAHDIRDADLFDFGYALTVHKAQGSQAKRVILFEERFAKMDDEAWRRWLYTGITRAQEELFVIG